MYAKGMGCWGGVSYLGTLGNRDCQLAPRSVLKDFFEDAFTTSADTIFLNGTTRKMKTY